MIHTMIQSAVIVVMIMSSMVESFVVTPTPVGRSNNKHHGRLFSRLDTALDARKDVTIPLLDLSDSEHANDVITPLPAAHLPSELSTLHLYGMELRRPVHKMLVEKVVSDTYGGGEVQERMYGYIVDKPDEDSLVGAIGCTGEIILEAQPQDADKSDSEVGDDSPLVVLSRGAYRFKVKEVVKTFPFPVAVVDELTDEELSESDTSITAAETEDDDDEDDGLYAEMDATELVRRIMVGLKTLIDQKLDAKKPELSPLEKSILEETGQHVADVDANALEVEEMAAVFDIFQSTLIDIAPMPVDRYYAVAMLAAEMANVDNDVRKDLIIMTDGVARMRIVLRELEAEVSMNQARRVADSITDEIDEGNKDLKVGKPELPPFLSRIKDGTRVEYFWSEKEGWCGGVVHGEPMKVLDELIVSIRFDDGETHKLPITADEKVRWRPPQEKN